MRIVFLGTPEFATASLDILVQNGLDIAAVVTAPDRPAGRGLQPVMPDIKKYALNKGIQVLQPEKLKDPVFLETLKSFKADLQIVVAFRMLPEAVWNMPRLGTFNLHASLLPQYRGAAPINRAIMNGETASGVTTFFLQQEIDTGKIIFQEQVSIAPDENAGELHDELMNLGAKLVLKTVRAIEQGSYPQQDQETVEGTGSLKQAPKIFRDDCRINWKNGLQSVHNQIRGLSPYPAAFTELITPDGKIHSLKVFRATPEYGVHSIPNGNVDTDGRTYIRVALTGGCLRLEEIQLAGKKRMTVIEFLRGFPLTEQAGINPG
ncbi:MAG: methionyl-tRNA formyltransferase [Bacteroidia bacterium]